MFFLLFLFLQSEVSSAHPIRPAEFVELQTVRLHPAPIIALLYTVN